MTASQMVSWKIIDEGTTDAIRIVLAQIFESMRLDIRRLTSQPEKTLERYKRCQGEVGMGGANGRGDAVPCPRIN